MGAVGCEIHDLSAGIIVCPHISEFIVYRTFEEHKNEVIICEIDSVTIKKPYKKRFAYCSECKKKYLLPTIFFWIYYNFYFTFPLELDIKMRACRVCIECFYKELFNIELKRFYPKEGVIEFTPTFTGKDLKILLTDENKN